jgi:peptidoglycan hydrolase-like protein with peptidoglycan-binding domain
LPDMKLPALDRTISAGAPAKRLARGETTLTRLIGHKLLRHPLPALGWLTAAGISVCVFTNIMLLQPERHRAPMFVGNPLIHATPQPSQTPLPPARPANLEREAELTRKAALVQDIQTELGRRGFFTGETDPSATAKTASAIRDFQTAARLPVNGQATESLLASVLTSNLTVKDQILGLLKTNTDRLERPETVVAMQRALTKIGYGPLRDDGHFGAGTRAALDKFERDRKLPARGENPARTLRELAQTSGIAID